MGYAAAAARATETECRRFGETVRYEHRTLAGSTIDVRAVGLDDAQLIDAGQSVWVYQAEVLLLAADLVDEFGAAVAVQPDGELVRRPTQWPAGTDERWYLTSAQPVAGGWRCLAQRPVR